MSLTGHPGAGEVLGFDPNFFVLNKFSDRELQPRVLLTFCFACIDSKFPLQPSDFWAV